MILSTNVSVSKWWYNTTIKKRRDFHKLSPNLNFHSFWTTHLGKKPMKLSQFRYISTTYKKSSCIKFCYCTNGVATSAAWVFICVRRQWACMKPFPHTLQTCGVSPVWILLCTFKFVLLVNLRPHTSHSWFLSPVWIIMCLFRSELNVNFLPQTEHSNGLAEECLFRWFLKAPALLNAAPHSGQTWSRRSECPASCDRSADCWVKPLPQELQV